MRFVYGLALAVMAVTALGSVMPASAQNVLDTPTVQVVGSNRAAIILDVEAGASGAPAGFVVEWMKKSDFDALGGWPADENDYRIVYCQFYGKPTWHVSTGDYVLGPNGTVQVHVGDIFDETGLYANYDGELDNNTPYVIRVHAEGTAAAAESPRSGDVFGATLSPLGDNCTFTQGYWKNHPEAWPVASLTLGNHNYTAAELLSILNTPAGGNGLLILAHQLIAAKLNIADGADPTPVAGDIAAADGIIGNLVIPPVGSDTLLPSDVNPYDDNLNNYNNGTSGVPHCGSVKAETRTWGSIKGIYH
ncbi:MAG TPA: hypothetical protein VKF80_11305 [Candidatus Eisenbacteria bacterium]|nr:hypothetical protein [Candidatus Eisenbacteria bacterium]